jgi:hypothetical protein
MQALAALPNIRVTTLSSGKLSVYEEFPEAIANAVKSFLAEDSPPVHQLVPNTGTVEDRPHRP